MKIGISVHFRVRQAGVHQNQEYVQGSQVQKGKVQNSEIGH